MTDDRGAAALAERLHAGRASFNCEPHARAKGKRAYAMPCEIAATAILGEYGVFWPGGGYGHESPEVVLDLLARLDAVEARERALRDAVDLAYRWVDFTPEGVDGLRSRMRRALSPEPNP